jgi:hypothetical protein
MFTSLSPAHLHATTMTSSVAQEQLSLPHQLCELLQSLASSTSIVPPITASPATPHLDTSPLSGVSSLTPASFASLCDDVELVPLVDLLLSLTPSHVRPPPLAESPVPPSTTDDQHRRLSSLHSSLSHLQSCSTSLANRVHTMKQTLSSHGHHLTSSTLHLTSLQSSLDLTAQSAIDCLSSLLPSSPPSCPVQDEWSESFLSSYLDGDEQVEEGMRSWLNQEGQDCNRWKRLDGDISSDDGDKDESVDSEDWQVELDGLVDALDVAHRSSIHSRLHGAAVRARLQTMDEQRQDTGECDDEQRQSVPLIPSIYHSCSAGTGLTYC